MKKVNPRKIPRSQEDVDRAWEKGVLDGVSNACAIFMTVLCDKFNGGDYIVEVWAVLCSVEGYVTPYVTTANYGRRPSEEEPVFWRLVGYTRQEIDNVTAWMYAPEPYEGKGKLDELLCK